MPGIAGVAAIGVVGSVASGVIGANAAKKASAAQQATQQAALAENRRQFDQTTQNLAPFLGAGQGAVGGLVQGSTAGGLDARLQEIMAGGAFQNLLGERTRATQGGLAAAGLTRSGQGIRQLADVSTQTGLDLEGLLTGRLQNLAGSGQNAAAQQGGFGQNFAQSQAGLLTDLGRTQSQGILGGQQALATGISQGAGFAQQFARDINQPNQQQNQSGGLNTTQQFGSFNPGAPSNNPGVQNIDQGNNPALFPMG